jgi:hypothetical protein
MTTDNRFALGVAQSLQLAGAFTAVIPGAISIWRLTRAPSGWPTALRGNLSTEKPSNQPWAQTRRNGANNRVQIPSNR